MYINDEPVLLIDGSPFLYIHGGTANYKNTVDEHIEKLLLVAQTEKYLGFLDGKNNFRKELADNSGFSKYKGTRASKEDRLEKIPFMYRVRDYLVEKYNFIFTNGVEADDVLGMYNRKISGKKYLNLFFDEVPVKKELSGYSSIIASIDKDLYTLNGFHLDLKSKEIISVNDSSSYIKLSENRKKLSGIGYKFRIAQTLMGDSADNIKGLFRCGPVKTYSLLKDVEPTQESFYKAAKDAYISQYEEKEQAIKDFENTYKLVDILETTDVPSLKINILNNEEN